MLNEFDAGATLPVTDMAAAREFYEGTLGFEPVEGGDIPGAVLYKTGSGAFLVYQSEHAGTNKATAMAFNIPDDRLDGVIDKLRSKGISFDTFDAAGMEGMEWDGIVLTGGGMRAVWFHDAWGNIINISTMPS